ncbi:T-cell activation Rho GTPase-activating protein isoform X1 [Dipodomys spectabilis]|uniref:T-cell activation Rho GTPase-activating protein isoform X1 n=2 Tax=Dipodomys spectabilis TaxID=105255 RepID=UPI001C53BA88|nr:T-cell activation Rho GTPase-activating protein isoform X1 [Dipodomys spectabilis]
MLYPVLHNPEEVKGRCLRELLRNQSPNGVEFVPCSHQQPMKVIGSFDASKTLNANNMETLIECQSEGDIKDHPLLMSCESEDSVCQLSEVKKRKKVLSWPFLIRRLSPSSDFSGSLEPELKVSLFDQPLSMICGEDTLPRPIQDILTILCLKGPSTEGIFRKAASEKARKELKEELNGGSAVDLEVLPVHLLAVVFKDFLRGIPGKLLSCDLFEDWMGALEQQEEEDRIEALKQVADRLPWPNLLLLKHLLCVLHLISKNAEVNRMDSSNLAICIGPNMLTLENDQHLSFQAQKALNNKVKTLVEFLIDNCFEIFGENIPAHSRITSDDSLDHTDSSDVSMLQNDSAYDSNDPDAETSSATSPPSRPTPGLTTSIAGLDSGVPQDTCDLSPEPIVSTVARLRRAVSQTDRRFSEPSMPPSQECLESRMTNQKLTKSKDDFTMPGAGSHFESEKAEDPFPAESKPKRPANLKLNNLSPGLAGPQGLAPKAFSSSSLDGSSDSSPVPSPSCPKRNFFTRHQSFTMKTEKGKPNREIKKHSLSFSLASHKKVLLKTPSFESGKPKDITRDQVKKGWRKESQLAGRIVQENQSDTHSQAAVSLSSPSWALSVDDVFQLADRGSLGSPPSYQEAIQLQASGFMAYGSQTVGSMRARMLSQDSKLPPLPHGQSIFSEGKHDDHTPMTEHLKQSRTVSVSVETQAGPEFHRLRTRSESMQKDKQDSLGRRCSQPIFDADQLQYARESYI